MPNTIEHSRNELRIFGIPRFIMKNWNKKIVSLSNCMKKIDFVGDHFFWNFSPIFDMNQTGKLKLDNYQIVTSTRASMWWILMHNVLRIFQNYSRVCTYTFWLSTPQWYYYHTSVMKFDYFLNGEVPVSFNFQCISLDIDRSRTAERMQNSLSRINNDKTLVMRPGASD